MLQAFNVSTEVKYIAIALIAFFSGGFDRNIDRK